MFQRPPAARQGDRGKLPQVCGGSHRQRGDLGAGTVAAVAAVVRSDRSAAHLTPDQHTEARVLPSVFGEAHQEARTCGSAGCSVMCGVRVARRGAQSAGL
ncbi:hypothetical protein GCM10018791_71480 [Streptomyces zaomyceticus]|nr:hypothetical protein GCM10018791_71480 [Streptomyces zaomyceticus]